LLSSEVSLESFFRELRHLIQRTRLIKQMGGPRNDVERWARAVEPV